MDDAVTTEDLRRAAAYLSHYIRADVPGINAVLAEADQGQRISFLLLGVTALCRQVSPELFTEQGAERLAQAAVELSKQPPGQSQA